MESDKLESPAGSTRRREQSQTELMWSMAGGDVQQRSWGLVCEKHFNN
jgi:hypothetical protein